MAVFRRTPESRISHSFLTQSPGGRPGAGYLLLRGQKKLTEEKAAPDETPFGYPCAARQGQRLLNSRSNMRRHITSERSDNNRNPVLACDCSASQTGSQVRALSRETLHHGCMVALFKLHSRAASAGCSIDAAGMAEASEPSLRDLKAAAAEKP